MNARVVIVGAGPAGVRCAEALVAQGLRPVVVDESMRDGGQIYRRQPEGFRRTGETLYGSEARKAASLHATFDRLQDRIDYRPRTLAWNVAADKLHVIRDGLAEAVPWDALVLCPGAVDRLLPVPGWQWAGTFTLGGAQVALKGQACAIGRRTVFAGSGPLLYLAAAQYAEAGADVAAVLDTSTFAQSFRALPGLAAKPALLAKGAGLLAGLRRRGIPVRRGIRPVAIEGDADHGVRGFAWREGAAGARRVDCDAIALGWHLRPETQLAELAGCEFAWDALTGQWLPRVDEDGRIATPRVYLAGDGARVLGADAAEDNGRLAALAALADLGLPVDPSQPPRLRERLTHHRRFADALARAYPWPGHLAASLPDEALVCRCEGLTAGQLRETAKDPGADEINRAKALMRVGMGRCQGRYCGHAAAEVLAAASGCPPDAVGRLRVQAPVKPIAIATDPAPPPESAGRAGKP